MRAKGLSIEGRRLTVVLALLVVMLASSAGALQVQAAGGQAAVYAAVFDAAYYAQKYPDLRAIYGNNEDALLSHFLTCGMAEGRQGNAEFDVQYYRAKYPDLQAVYGDQLQLYYMHYMSAGRLEGRAGHAGAAAPASGTPVPSAQTQQPGVQSSSPADRVIELVNQRRAEAGVAPLTKSDALTMAAQARSNELLRVFSHKRPDGRSCFTMLAEYGIGYGAAGENIAAGQHTPEEVVNAWMNSPGHRANILNASYHKIGVGLVDQPGTGYQYYWTQMFTD